MALLLNEEVLPEETLTLLRESATERNVSVEVEVARLVKEGLARNGSKPARSATDWGPPSVVPDVTFRDPPGTPVVPVFKGDLPYESCCDLDDPSQRVPE